MNLRATALCILLAWPLYGMGSILQPNATWYGEEGSLPGEFWSVQVLSSDATGTRLLIECPGFWIQEVNQGGETRTQVILPESGILTQAGLPEIPVIGRLLAIPDDRNPELIVHNVEYQSFPCGNPCLVDPLEGSVSSSWQQDTDGIYPADLAVVEPPAIFKDLRVTQVNIFPVRYDPSNEQLILTTSMEIEVQTIQTSSVNVKTDHKRPSEAFAPLYNALIDNYDEFNTATPLVGEGARGAYLIIFDDITYGNLLDEVIESHAVWKRQLGYQVIIERLSEIGSMREAIKDVVMTHYYGGSVPLDYVLLIGDISYPINIPAYSIVKPGGGEQDVTDHPYAMLEGLDYFPDVMIGRFSVSTDFELATAINRTKFYQLYPHITGTEWLTEALVVAGNFSDVGNFPITPVWTSLWLVDKLYDHGYQQVDTVFCWQGQGPPYPGTSLITESLNDGVGIVAYRGWADANGWQYPVFGVEHVNSLLNTYNTPVVVSMVCNTGDFGNVSIDPCFGEAWIRAGTPVNPIGGVAFVGPSDLHTNTKWNNALYAGFFEGLLEENLYRVGQATIRSKFELYYGFPDNTGTGDFAEFYFHVYNILGDPELPIWTKVPQTVNLEIPEQLAPGNQIVTATITDDTGAPLGGAYVAFYKEDEVLAGGVTSSAGTVAVEVEPITEGNLFVTTSKQNYLHVQDTILVAIDEFPLGISSIAIAGTGTLTAGETADLTVTLYNYGSGEITGVNAELSENDSYISVTSPSASVGTVSAGGEVGATFTVDVMPHCPEGHVIEFTLDLENDAPNTKQTKFLLPVGGLLFMPVELTVEDGSFTPGGSADFRLSIYNAGILTANQPTGTLTSADPAVSIVANTATYPVMLTGTVGLSSSTFSLEIDNEAQIGQQVILDLEISAADGFVQTVNFPVQLGELQSTDPLGPDSYGYYAYDNTDSGYDEAPAFEWIELDPDYGGVDAELHQLGDDVSTVVELPFAFTYYGVDYDTITICSNGWISMGSTWMANFRNWNMPSALGPPALIAVFWDDLKADTTGGYSYIDVFTRYDESEGRFTIEWSRSINRFQYEVYQNWHEETFEIVLLNPTVHQTETGDGEIIMQYYVVNDVDDNNNYATVGMEDEGHRRGLQYVYANNYSDAAAYLENGRAIKFTTDPPGAFGDGIGGGSVIPDRLQLFAPIPNPANPTALLSFQLPHSGLVRVDLYNTLGRRVVNLLNEYAEAGLHQVKVQGDHLSSGIYFILLNFEDQTLARKVLILK